MLSLTTLYPGPTAPQAGLFVRARLQAMAAVSTVTVVAPQARASYSKGLTGIWIPAAEPGRTLDGSLEVWRPCWWYPPAAGPLNAVALALQAGPLVWRLHRERRFELIDAHFGQLDGIAAAIWSARLGLPFSVTLRGSEADHAEYGLRRRAMAWSFRRAAAIVALSERLAQLAVSLGADPARVCVIPNGIDETVFHPKDRSRSRAEEGLAGERLILMAGHLIELKGYHVAVRALRGLVDRGHDAHLWIAGGGGGVASYEAEIRREIAQQDVAKRVRLLGAQPQERLARLMSAADVFCLASRREGFPNVLQESLACGLPAVATNVGAVPQMLPDGRYGIIARAGEDGALLEALDVALRREWDRSTISAWGMRRSWPNVASEVIQAFEKACLPGGMGG